MGKNLKGKECGKGICQRKDGKYAARYTAKDGSRKEKHFDTLPEARNWLADSQYEDKHNVHTPSSEMTVDNWFEFWITNLIADLAPNTKRNYRERYRMNIQPVIGNMRMCDVKPMHCKIVLNRMEATYAGSTIRQAYIAMGTMFRAAVMNDMLTKHPMDGVRYTKPVRAVDDIKFLTVEEQKIFLETAKRSHNYRQYVLLLETGLRTSEMIGLTWEFHRLKKADIDRQQDTGISTQYKNMAFRSSKVEKQLPHYSADKPGIRCIKIVLRRTSHPQGIRTVVSDSGICGSPYSKVEKQLPHYSADKPGIRCIKIVLRRTSHPQGIRTVVSDSGICGSPYRRNQVSLYERFGVHQFPYRRACKEQFL